MLGPDRRKGNCQSHRRSSIKDGAKPEFIEQDFGFKTLIPLTAKEKSIRVKDDSEKLQLNAIELKILHSCQKPFSMKELLKLGGYSSRSRNFRQALNKMLNHKLIEITCPEKPRSKNQKYRLTRSYPKEAVTL